MVSGVKGRELICGGLLLVVHVHFLLEEVFIVSSYVNTTFTYDVEVLPGQEDLMFPSFDEGRHASASGESSTRRPR
jgi:hypothetical protein